MRKTVALIKRGAFTSQVSASLLKEVGCSYTLVGHSETRIHQGVSHEEVIEKTIMALQADIIPIVCLGESREAYENGKTQQILHAEISAFPQLNGN